MLETVAMLLAELLAAAGAADGAEEGLGATAAAPLRRRRRWWPGMAIGPVVLHGARMRRAACWPTTRQPSWPGCTRRSSAMQRGLDELITDRLPGGGKADAGSARGAGGLPPGRRRPRLAAPGRRGDPRRPVGRGGGAPRRRRAARPHAPHRRPLSARAAGRPGGPGRPAAGGAGRRRRARRRCRRARSCWRAGSARPSCWTGTRRGIAGAGDRGGQPGRPCRHPGPRARPARRSAARAASSRPPSTATR